MTGDISFSPNMLQRGNYTIKITVEDQDGLTASASFKLTVLRKNAPPNITLVKPKSGSKALVDRNVYLSADASDPDGDPLDYYWWDGGVYLGAGSGMLAAFNTTGIHNVTLVVSDGRANSTYNFTLNIVRSLPSKPTPGFDAGLWACAIAVLCLATFIGRRRRTGPTTR
jgi:hypothetical protein